MPYIRMEEREKYYELIDQLFDVLKNLENDVLAGELNFVFFSLADMLVREHPTNNRNYARMAVVSSALSEAQAEFRRRNMGPYEDKAIIKNGDIL